MSRKKKKKSAAPQPKKSRAEQLREQEIKQKRTKITLIVFAIVAAATILALTVIAVVSAVLDAERVDVLKDDLDKYIKLSESDYKDYPVNIKLDPVDDLAVDNALMQALYASRFTDTEYGSKVYNVKDSEPLRPLAAGDVVYAYYIGYELGEGGERIYFNGGCNFGDRLSASNSLGLGSGSFITGFELGLVGKSPWSYSSLTKVTEGEVKQGDIISFSMVAMYSDGSTADKKSYTTVVDAASCDRIYGEGFADFLIGRSTGEIEDSFTTKDVSDKSATSVYTDISIDAIYDVGSLPMTVEARFPVSYSEKSLAGKTVRFDVFVEKVQYYSTPEVDEKFVTEKLGLTAEQLAEYGEEGDSLIECYRGYLESNLKAKAYSDSRDAIVVAFWERVNERVKVKRLPRGDVNDYYNDYITDITNMYNQGNSSDYTLDEYAITYLELDRGADWRASVRESAEGGVTEKLIFYYIIRKEGFFPSEQEHEQIYKRLVDEMVDSVLQYQGKDKESLTDAEYDNYRNTVIEGYGEAYFNENVQYEYAMEKIVALAKVTYE